MRAVCTSLRDAVNHDILPWLQLTVTRPLSARLSDNVLLQLCAKSRGRLTALTLINCTKITDRALQIVSENNPFIKKLHVPGCTGLTLDGIVRAVKTLTERSHSLTSLKINGVYNIDKLQLQVLNSFLQQTNPYHHKQPSLRLYQQFKSSSILYDDDAPIDVSICPVCDEVKMVFDCSRQYCNRKKGRKVCRGCDICVPRCVECGGCFESDEDEEETACNHTICSACWFVLPKCSFCNKPFCMLEDCSRCRLPNSTVELSERKLIQRKGREQLLRICDTCCARFVRTTAVVRD